MSNVFTLDNLNREIDRQYGPFRFQAAGTEFELAPVLRLPKKVRQAAGEALKRVEKAEELAEVEGETRDSEDIAVDSIKDALRLVVTAGSPEALFEALRDEHGEDNLIRLMAFLNAYSEKTQPGEASGSAS